MDGVQLKLNLDKTEFIVIGDKHTRVTISPAEGVKILGATFDSENSFRNHITVTVNL